MTLNNENFGEIKQISREFIIISLFYSLIGFAVFIIAFFYLFYFIILNIWIWIVGIIHVLIKFHRNEASILEIFEPKYPLLRSNIKKLIYFTYLILILLILTLIDIILDAFALPFMIILVALFMTLLVFCDMYFIYIFGKTFIERKNLEHSGLTRVNI